MLETGIKRVYSHYVIVKAISGKNRYQMDPRVATLTSRKNSLFFRCAFSFFPVFFINKKSNILV